MNFFFDNLVQKRMRKYSNRLYMFPPYSAAFTIFDDVCTVTIGFGMFRQIMDFADMGAARKYFAQVLIELRKRTRVTKDCSGVVQR